MTDDMETTEQQQADQAGARPERGANDVSALTHIVTRHAQLNAQIKEMKFEQKELEDSAPEKCGKSPKAIRQLSKESAWDAVKRESQRQLEEEIDQGRAALGLLADTPLGQAEIERMADERLTKGWLQDEPRKKRGRPKGSRNKPKAEAPAVPAAPEALGETQSPG